ncbi:MAG TPA: TonB-dependent siderophore receptor [Steroidobacteraceae bacterium]|nr:TonB-dependent siderophore receptor [Steroidobacteraceae bacterium]
MVASSGHFVLRGKRATLVGMAVACALAVQGAYAQTAEQSSSDDKTVRDTVVVTANGSQVELPADYAGGQVARGGRIGLFGNLDMMDTPFNATDYTAEFIRDQQASSVADVVQSDPAVRVSRGYGNFQELYIVRGFPVYSDDMSYNGLYGLLPRQYVAAEFLERVEVFRGANTFLNGAAPGGSGVGGSFNLVPKRASDQDITRLTVGWENHNEAYGAADVSRRFGDDRQFGVRVNFAHRDGQDSVDDEQRKLTMASIGADFRSDKFKASVDLGFQDHHIDAPRPSVTPTTSVPSAPDAATNFAQPWTYTEEHDFFGVARGEYNFTDTFKVWAATGLRKGSEHNILANPTVIDDSGDTSSYRFDNYRKDLITTSEVGVRGEFETGLVKHKMSASGSIFELNSKNSYAFSSFTGFAGNLYNPYDVAPPDANFFTGGVLLQPLTTNLTKTESAAIADIMSILDDRVFLTVGVREQRIQQYSFDYNTGDRNSSYDRSALTPVGGLLFKPWTGVSLYANYIEGLVQGAVAPVESGSTVISNSGEVFSPYRSKQYEVGAKYDHGTIGGTLAVFKITEPTTIVIGSVFSQGGEQRNQGFEFSSYGEITKGLRVLGGATYVDATTPKTTGDLYDGNQVLGIPKTSVNVGLEWDVSALHGLTVDGRVVYTSSQYADVANTLTVPSWTRLDLGARYSFTLADKLLTARLNVDNVTDKGYWAAVGGASGANYLVMGAPRTVVLSLSLDL